MTERACRTCSAYQRDNERMGTCHARAPRGFPQMQLNPVTQKPEVRMISGFPPMAADDWCRDDWRPAHERTN